MRGRNFWVNFWVCVVIAGWLTFCVGLAIVGDAYGAPSDEPLYVEPLRADPPLTPSKPGQAIIDGMERQKALREGREQGCLPLKQMFSVWASAIPKFDIISLGGAPNEAWEVLLLPDGRWVMLHDRMVGGIAMACLHRLGLSYEKSIWADGVLDTAPNTE